VALPENSSPPATPVEETIRKRRSAMHFEHDPIDLEDLSFVLEMAQGHGALERAPGVELYLAAHRVNDLAPGLYRYEPERHRLAQVRSGDLTRALVSACLGQKKAGTAAAGFLMVAKLTSAAARAGDRSYRDLLIESGAIGQRVYLAAEAAGLAARNLAAFVDDELNELMELDGRDEAVIHLTMLGRGD
jgi:SagB-type dehydrogenase family enzyme